MKTLLTLLLLSVSCLGQQQLRTASPRATALPNVPGRYRSIVTNSLVYYKEVQIMKATATEVSFTHEEGMATLGFDQMPTEIQRAYNYDPGVLLNPAVQAKMKKDRDDAVAIIAKSPTRAHVVITTPRADASICSAYLPIMEKTNKRTTNGYIMKEVTSKEPTRIIVIDAVGKPKGHDFGMVQLYPCGVDKFYGPMYAMDPGKAYDTLKAVEAKP